MPWDRFQKVRAYCVYCIYVYTLYICINCIIDYIHMNEPGRPLTAPNPPVLLWFSPDLEPTQGFPKPFFKEESSNHVALLIIIDGISFNQGL